MCIICLGFLISNLRDLITFSITCVYVCINRNKLYATRPRVQLKKLIGFYLISSIYVRRNKQLRKTRREKRFLNLFDANG